VSGASSGVGLSFAALFRHELRLWWRGFSRSKTKPVDGLKAFLIGLTVLAVIHALAWAFTSGLSARPVLANPANIIWLSGALLLLWFWMLSQALNSVTQALYSRGDVDLLLTSPMSMRKILTIRALALSVPVIFSWGFVLLPLANMMALLDNPHWLLAYPVMISLGLAATSLGLLMTMGLFRLIGPARTRTAGQILAVLIGATAFIAMQSQALLPESWTESASAYVHSLSDPATFDQNALRWLPARGIFGDLFAVSKLIISAGSLFIVSVWLFGGSYAAHVAAMAGATERARPREIVLRQTAPFVTGVRASLMRKEWRLLQRDPWLIGQVLLQLIYILPMGILFWKGSSMPGAPSAGLAPMLVMLSGQLAGGLVWITISGEDAPDLVAAAPVARAEIIRAKVLAATLPVAVILVLPIMALLLQSAWVGLWTLAGCMGAALSATFVSLWMQKPLPRRTFGYRQKGSVVANLAETALNFCWFFAAVELIWLSYRVILPLSMAAILLFTLYRWSRGRAEAQAFL